MVVARPAVDVVVPCVAGAVELAARMRSALALRDGDTLTVVDNRGGSASSPDVVVAADVHTAYFARNAGAARGRAPWLLFLDADVRPLPGLLDALFAEALPEDVGVLAGGVVDEPPDDASSWAVRYAAVKRSMSEQTVLSDRGEWGFAQTANALVRRSAFEAVGGFTPGIRSGGDADLCWRLVAAGWRLEARPRAAAVHVSRASVRALLGNRFRHGTGAAWLDARHPGSLPARSWPGLLVWGLRRFAEGIRAFSSGDADRGIEGVLDGPAVWAFELGRLVPNRPMQRRRAG